MTARLTPDEQHGLSLLFRRLSRGEDVGELLKRTPLVSLRAKVRRAEQRAEDRQHRWLAEHDERSVRYGQHALRRGE